MINPLNCVLPPSDMRHCVRLLVATAAIFSRSIKTSPCGHSSLSFLSSSWSHFNYHPPPPFLFSVFNLLFLFNFPSSLMMLLLSPLSSCPSAPFSYKLPQSLLSVEQVLVRPGRGASVIPIWYGMVAEVKGSDLFIWV